MRHQIAFVGGQLLPVFVGIKEFEPEQIHFIVSNESKVKMASMKSLLFGRSFTEYVCNPFDFASIKSTCERILAKTQPEDNIQFNLTGGTKIMVLAAQSLISERGLSGFYFNQNGTLLQLPAYEIRNVRSEISVKEFLEISGHKLSRSKTMADFSADDFRSVDEIDKFTVAYERVYFQAMSKIRNAFDDFSSIPSTGTITLNKSTNLLWTQKGITISSNASDIFRIESPHARSLFFNASWWELIVAREISKWPKAKELLIQCELPFKTDDKVLKNEIDVLVNVGGKLLFIECKSGMVKQADLNKMKVVKDTYGGVISKSLLVCRFPPPPTIIEKCKELNIDVFHTHLGNRQITPLSRILNTLDKLEKRYLV